MNFDFSPEQFALRDAVADALARAFPVATLRARWDGAVADRDAWRALAGIGVFGMLVDEVHGGVGGTEVDLVLAFEEVGRAGVPEPVVGSAAAAALLAEAGQAMADRCASIVAGDAIAVFGTPAVPVVAGADVADVLVYVDGARARVLDRGAFTATPADTVDRARPVSALEVPADAGEALEVDPSALGRAQARAIAGTAALLNGVSMRLLAMAIEHARERRQFGRAIGSFQAVAHQLADAHVRLDAARGAAWYAALALAARQPDAQRAASVAKVAANDASRIVNTAALQVHAGIGFTWEHDLHLFLKRGMALEVAWGTTHALRAALADHLFAEEGSDG